MASITPQNAIKEIHTYSPIPSSETEGESLSILVHSSSSTKPTAVETKDILNPVSELPTREGEIALLWGTIIMILLILFGWFLWWSQKEDHAAPILILNSLFISNFSVGTGGLVATWDAKFTLKNNSTFSELHYSHIGVTITYKDNPLSKTGSTFNLDEGQSAMLRMRFTNSGTAGWKLNEPYLENELVDKISKDVDKFGSLTIGMKMTMYAYYFDQRKWFPFFDKEDHEIITAHCDDLRVQFLPHNKDLGKLVNLNRNFSVPKLQRTYDMLG